MGGGWEDCGAEAGARFPVEEVVDVLIERGVGGGDLATYRADDLVLGARRGGRGSTLEAKSTLRSTGQTRCSVGKHVDCDVRGCVGCVGGASERERVMDACAA